MFRQELDDLSTQNPDRLTLVHVLSQEPHQAELLSGRLDRERLERILGEMVPIQTVDEWYLCGPSALVETARGLLTDLGADTRHVHHEVFDEPREPLASEPIT